MRKTIFIIFFVLIQSYLKTQELTTEQQILVSRFITLVKQKNKSKLAEIVSYPLKRRNPLPSINNKKEFIELFDDIFDETLIKSISNTSPKKDWGEIGWRGITYENGTIWLDTDGKLISINYESKKEKIKKEQLLTFLKSNLHESIRDFSSPCSIVETSKYRIRIDELKTGAYRYSSWNINKSMSEKPDIVINEGKIEFDGSGGNHSFKFKNQDYLYEIYIFVIGDDDKYDANLTIYKDNKEVFKQKARQILN